jgi:hypothetical protein
MTCLVLLFVQVFTNTAAALPCELGPDGCTPVSGAQQQQQQQQQMGGSEWLPISKFQRAWAQRVQGAKLHQQQQQQ